jgi:3-oxoadipate enol-lactonase
MTVPTLGCSVLPARSGSADAGLIVLGPSLGTTSAIWDIVALGLADTHRVLRYDLPGHGTSPAARARFTVSEIATAVIRLVDSVGGGPFFYAGDSLGSAVGLELEAGHPDRVIALIAFCAGATFGTPDGWRARAQQVRTSGTASVVEMSAARWFAPGYLDRDPGPGAAELDRLLEVDDESYALCCDALAVFDFTAQAASVRVPTLLVAGEFDIASPPSEVRALSKLIPDAGYLVIPGAGHLPVLERPVESEAEIRSVLHAANHDSDSSN